MTESFRIEQYSEERCREWNAFVMQSRQGTFLFDRHYMDYHSDRFHDASLMIYRGNALYALLPANAAGDTFHSHQGLTYGGLLTTEKATAADVCAVFRTVNTYLSARGFKHVVYKAIPWIYHRLPSEEDLYALTEVCHARLTAREISSAIMLQRQLKWTYERKRGMKRCLANGVVIRQSDDLGAFWQVLEDNLMASHGVRPVHTLQEMTLLKERFPRNIILYTATKDGSVLGGTLLYVTPQVVHSQYISASPEGKTLRVLDGIFDHILHEAFPHHQYFDFGKSTEDHGHYLNASLIHQKEGFGGRGVCYDTYEWEVPPHPEPLPTLPCREGEILG